MGASTTHGGRKNATSFFNDLFEIVYKKKLTIETISDQSSYTHHAVKGVEKRNTPCGNSNVPLRAITVPLNGFAIVYLGVLGLGRTKQVVVDT